MIDEAMGCDGPCAVCGRELEGCICLECGICGSVGDPRCYREHGLPLSAFQIASLAEAEARWRDEAAAELAQDAMFGPQHWEDV